MSTRSGKRQSWLEKMEKPQEPRVVETPPKMQRQFGAGRMLIATPALVDALMRKPSSGQLVTVNQIRQRLAEDFGADSTCPLTTGIFIRIAAEAAEEYRHLGREDTTPYWRTLKSDGSLSEKLPGGAAAQAQRLQDEGHTIEHGAGKRPPRVRDFEKHLVRL
jgi:hypothetical protein